MHFVDLALEHRAALNALFHELSLGLSEYSFANLYLFRQTHHYQVAMAPTGVYIKGRTRTGDDFLTPTKPVACMPQERLLSLLNEAACQFFFPIPEGWLPAFDPALFEYSQYDGDSEYLFYVSKMQTYKGRHLAKKRNLVKQYLQGFATEAHPLEAKRVGDARVLLDLWQSRTEMAPEDTDYFPCLEALEKREELELSGRIYYANGRPSGFLLGEALTEEIFALHFAKADIEFKGVYPALYQEFARQLDPGLLLLNLEEDSGQPALRQTKHSFHPDLLLAKWRITPKG